MEKQKIFWVILSVTVFVVVVLVVGLFLLKQSPDGLTALPARTEPAATAKPADTPAGIYEFGRDASSAEGDTEVLRFVIGGSETGTAAAGGGAATATPDAASPAPALPSASSAAAKPAAPAAKPAASTAVKPAARTPSATKPAATVRGPEYWIQTGSYKSQTRAEELSQMLTSKGLAGRVFSYAKSNETYFRVRIGPYVNEQEAEKFLSIVKTIQGLEASYISLVPGTRSAN